MPIEPDLLLDRRRLKRQLSVWRIMAIVAVVAAVVVAVGRFAGGFGGEFVARFQVDGIITQDAARDLTLQQIADDDNVLALIVHINSPGGTVVGGEDLYGALRRVAEDKPVVAVLGTLATSAGYMTAIAAEHIVARQGSVTGSIGVLLQTADFTRLLDSWGIGAESIKSSPLKAQPSPLEPLSPHGREASRAIVMDMYDYFVDLVVQRRGLERSAVLSLADGRVYTGGQAVDNGLIDAIGDERAAQAWLTSTHDIDPALPVRDVWVEEENDPWRVLALALTGKTFWPEALTLDGLVSLWHPQFLGGGSQ